MKNSNPKRKSQSEPTLKTCLMRNTIVLHEHYGHGVSDYQSLPPLTRRLIWLACGELNVALLHYTKQMDYIMIGATASVTNRFIKTTVRGQMSNLIEYLNLHTIHYSQSYLVEAYEYSRDLMGISRAIYTNDIGHSYDLYEKLYNFFHTDFLKMYLSKEECLLYFGTEKNLSDEESEIRWELEKDVNLFFSKYLNGTMREFFMESASLCPAFIGFPFSLYSMHCEFSSDYEEKFDYFRRKLDYFENHSVLPVEEHIFYDFHCDTYYAVFQHYDGNRDLVSEIPESSYPCQFHCNLPDDEAYDEDDLDSIDPMVRMQYLQGVQSMLNEERSLFVLDRCSTTYIGPVSNPFVVDEEEDEDEDPFADDDEFFSEDDIIDDDFFFDDDPFADDDEDEDPFADDEEDDEDEDPFADDEEDEDPFADDDEDEDPFAGFDLYADEEDDEDEDPFADDDDEDEDDFFS